MGEEFDRSVCLDRKLTEDETRELRITLMPYFLAEGGMESDDINDFLDYTFTMVSNSKTIEYIVGELDGFCSPEVSKKIGKQLADSILQLKGGRAGDEKDEDKDKAEEDADGEGVDRSVTKVCISGVVRRYVCVFATSQLIKLHTIFLEAFRRERKCPYHVRSSWCIERGW